MNGDMQERGMSGTVTRRKALLSEVRWQWLVGIANMLLILASFVLAVVKAPTSVRSNNMRCLQEVANEEHVSLEALFQNPGGQDALVQAMTICSR